jgi:aminopeptidase N
MSHTRAWSLVPALWAGLVMVVAQPVFGQRLPSVRRLLRGADAPRRAERPAAPGTEPFRTAVDRPFDVKDIRLDLRVDLPKQAVDGRATLQVRSLRPIKAIQLDAVEFTVRKVTLQAGDGPEGPTTYKHDGQKLLVELGGTWPAGRRGTLRVDYRVHKPRGGLHFFAPTKADPEAPLTVWSQGEPTTNRYWFPCVDQPAQRQTTELVVTAPQGFEVLSNGTLVSHKDNPDKTVTFDWKQDKPHPAYLVTLVVGQFDVVREEWDKVPVVYYVPKGKKDQVATTFRRTRDMLGYFSRRFGIRYPWAKYAQVVAYNFGGGMENTSATTMGDILQDKHSLLDGNSDGIIAHELAHQWWGDLVTCRDWAHIWLNEGFASYAECLWDEESKGPDAYAYNLFRKAQQAIRGGKDRPVVDRHYTRPMTMFDARAYPKGAWILHMLRRRLGEEAFWNGIRRYGEAHRLQSAETYDFRRTLERETGRSLERFFYDWTERPGNPDLEVTTEYLPAARQARVSVKQTQSGEPFHFPLMLRFVCSGDARPTEVEYDVTGKEFTVLVPLASPLTRVDVDPEQAVLAEIKETKGRDLWAAQLLESPSVPLRIRAARHFKESKAEADRELLARALAHEKSWGVATEIATALAGSGGDTCRAALLEGLGQGDARVRRACAENLGKLPPDDKTAGALKGVLDRGDPSYAVCGAALVAYAKQGRKDAVTVLTPWLQRPSHRDVLCGSALLGLAEAHDVTALDTLLHWAERGKPRNARAYALQGLVQLLRKGKPDRRQRQRIWDVLNSSLTEDAGRGRFMVMMALPELGSQAAPVLAALDKIAKDDANERVRAFAQRIADRIRAQSPSGRGRASDEVSQLRKEVERLKREQAELRDRLSKFEKALEKKQASSETKR